MPMPRVSVLVDNRNYARYLGQAVRSVLEQDVPAEIVVVDDASTDDSLHVLEEFGSTVKVIARRTNGGQAAAFNDGLAAVTGEIVCLLDSDDWWAPGKLRKVLERFEKDSALGMVQHWCREIGENGRELGGRLPTLPATWDRTDFLEGRCVFTGTSGLAFRTAALKALLPIPEEIRISADSWLYYSVLDAPVGNIDEVLAYRRVHGENQWAGRLLDTGRLERNRRALGALRAGLERRLAQRRLSLSETARTKLRQAELMDELFLSVQRGQWETAWALWREALSWEDGARKVFKASSLLLLMASPTLYLALRSAYGRLRA